MLVIKLTFIFLTILGIICLILIGICQIQLNHIRNEMQQLNNIQQMLDEGCSLEQILQQPMPKELRKQLEKIMEEIIFKDVND